jgi:hypothetical protein
VFIILKLNIGVVHILVFGDIVDHNCLPLYCQEAVKAKVACQLDFHLPMESVTITANIVAS